MAGEVCPGCWRGGPCFLLLSSCSADRNPRDTPVWEAECDLVPRLTTADLGSRKVQRLLRRETQAGGEGCERSSLSGPGGMAALEDEEPLHEGSRHVLHSRWRDRLCLDMEVGKASMFWKAQVVWPGGCIEVGAREQDGWVALHPTVGTGSVFRRVMPADTTPETESVFLSVSPASSTTYSHTGFFSLTFLYDIFHLCK